MAGIDEAVRLAEAEGYQRLEKLLSMRENFLKKTENCRHIRVCPLTEPGKLVIFADESFMSGQLLYDILRDDYHLQMEMAAGSYVVAILTMMDEERGLDRLSNALMEIDVRMETLQKGFADKGGKGVSLCGSDFCLRPAAALDLWEAYEQPSEETELGKAQGKVAAEFVNLYPPGIPLLVPGEVLDGRMTEIIRGYMINGYTVQGINDNKIRIVKSI